eukprot:7081818-Lingulodinium_polyedra.AAC.1
MVMRTKAHMLDRKFCQTKAKRSRPRAFAEVSNPWCQLFTPPVVCNSCHKEVAGVMAISPSRCEINRVQSKT